MSWETDQDCCAIVITNTTCKYVLNNLDPSFIYRHFEINTEKGFMKFLIMFWGGLNKAKGSHMFFFAPLIGNFWFFSGVESGKRKVGRKGKWEVEMGAVGVSTVCEQIFPVGY